MPLPAAATLRTSRILSAVGQLRLLGFVFAGLAQAASIAWPTNGQPLWWLQLASMAVLVGLLDRLRAEPGLAVGDNQPYCMDETDYTVPTHAYPARRPYVEMEVRQEDRKSVV